MNLRRQITALLLLLPAAVFAVPFSAPQNDGALVAGRDYIELPTPVPVSTGSALEVREFFFYGCSHCHDLEPAVNAWLKTKPADVVLVRTPAVLSPKWQLLGRAFYVAEELKMLEKIHTPLYTAIHVGRERFESPEAVGRFFVRMGASQAQFEAAWNSFSVNTKVKNADALARKYMIQGTPTLTVNGRYVVPAAGPRTFAIVDQLLARERAAKLRK